MYSNRFREVIRDLDELTVKQRRFSGRIAFRIPQLIKAISTGKTEARCELGRKLELELVARAPENKWVGIGKTWGKVSPPAEAADDSQKTRTAKR